MPEQASGDSAPARLDVELVRRGLARSRATATAAITEGRVSVDGATVLKPASKVVRDAVVALDGGDRWVSRSAGKLDAALDEFGVVVAGALALDVGASTGGFTQVLLERGAREVIALDVGHGQLAAVVRDDPRVRVVEGVNARELTPELLFRESGVGTRPNLVVADVSFIPLGLVLPAIAATVDPAAEYILLVKPQFEVGRTGVREGVVHDRDARHDALSGVLWQGWDLGLGTAGIVASTVVGSAGNQEYLVHFAPGGADPSDWRGRMAQLP